MADDIDDTQDGGGSTQTPAPPDVGGGTVAPPGPVGNMFTGQSGVVQSPGGPQRPSYFKNIIKELGLVLSQGALAGVQAPQNPQGPAIAAATAANMPQARFEQGMRNKAMMTSERQRQLSIAQAQITLHQLQSMALTLPENQQEAVYNTMRDRMQELTGKVEELGTGSLGAMTDELARRQHDANAAGQKGLLPLHILPAVDSTYKDRKYVLYAPKGTLTEDIPEVNLRPSDLGYDKDQAKAAGLSDLKLPKIPAGTRDWEKVQNDRYKQIALYQARSETQIGQWNRTQATIGNRNEILKSKQSFDKWKVTYQEAQKNARANMAAARGAGRDLQNAVNSWMRAANMVYQADAKKGIGERIMGFLDPETKTLVESESTARSNLNNVASQYGMVLGDDGILKQTTPAKTPTTKPSAKSSKPTLQYDSQGNRITK